MKEALQYVSWAVGLWLELLVIYALWRGPYRQYRLALAYAVALLLATVVEISAATAKPALPLYIYYWIDEGILDILVFCVVIGFIDQAAARARRRPVKRRWLIAGAALIVVTSGALRIGPAHFNHRMTLVSRDLNLCAVVLDLILWSILITSRSPDRHLLLLSGGLGIQLTGAIIGESVGQISRAAVFPGVLLEVLTFFAGLYIWWRAFRIGAAQPPTPPVTEPRA